MTSIGDQPNHERSREDSDTRHNSDPKRPTLNCLFCYIEALVKVVLVRKVDKWRYVEIGEMLVCKVRSVEGTE